jgi:hypothetical protein
VSDRLDPEVLAADATKILSHTVDVHALVVSLLREIRLNCDREQAIRDGYAYSAQQNRDWAQRCQDEANEYREALRTVKRAVRHITVGRA